MAKPSVVEARKAQAMADQAEAIQQLADQIAKLEAKIDQVIANQQTAPATPRKTKEGAA